MESQGEIRHVSAAVQLEYDREVARDLWHNVGRVGSAKNDQQSRVVGVHNRFIVSDGTSHKTHWQHGHNRWPMSCAVPKQK